MNSQNLHIFNGANAIDPGEVRHNNPESMTRFIDMSIKGSAHQVRSALEERLSKLNTSGLLKVEVVGAVGSTLGVFIDATKYSGFQQVISTIHSVLGESLVTADFKELKEQEMGGTEEHEAA